MISRRLVRIKTLQTLYAFNRSENGIVTDYETLLQEKFDAAYDAYLFVLDFPYHLREFALEKQNREKSKFYPKDEKIDHYRLLNGTKMVEGIHNQVVGHAKEVFDWSSLELRFDQWLRDIKEWDFVRDYGIFFEPNHDQQKEFLESLYFALLDTHETFNEAIEEVYPYWFDDYLFTSKDIVKTISLSENLESLNLKKRTTSKSEEVIWAKGLLRNTIENSDEYNGLIAKVASNWDPARIAVMDLLIIKLAISEFLNCPEIPLRVTINEYLEITKSYSTPSSSKFVNGILDKLRLDLESRGEIRKTGRGLK